MYRMSGATVIWALWENEDLYNSSWIQCKLLWQISNNLGYILVLTERRILLNKLVSTTIQRCYKPTPLSRVGAIKCLKCSNVSNLLYLINLYKNLKISSKNGTKIINVPNVGSNPYMSSIGKGRPIQLILDTMQTMVANFK